MPLFNYAAVVFVVLGTVFFPLLFNAEAVPDRSAPLYRTPDAVLAQVA
jgi:hypothetical protein